MKTLFSGIQPSGNLHLGNYIGAISQWTELQKNYHCILCVVDYHAITVKQNPKILNKIILDVARIYLASGIDPKKGIIFQQSDIKEHTELGWILNTLTKVAELEKMTQYKDKTNIQDIRYTFEKIKNYLLESNKETKAIRNELVHYLDNHDKNIVEKSVENLAKIIYDSTQIMLDVMAKEKENIKSKEKTGSGLLTYPTLMAADILLYNTDVVPVGEDQTQHLEMTRTLARRFNNDFGETFKVPETIIRKEGARIMSLDDPTKKMSKSSNNPNSYIALLDEPILAHKKIKRAVTDSGKEVRYDVKNKAAISNLLTIYSVLAKKSIKELEVMYENKNYGEFKEDLANIVANFLENFQAKYKKYSDREVKKILAAGAKQARKTAERTMKLVKHNLGVN